MHGYRSTLRFGAAAAGAALAVGFGPALQASAATEPPSPATGHAAVVAQGVVAFTDGPLHWEIAHHDLVAGATPAPIGATAPYFLVADAGAAVVAVGDSLTRLAAGEGALVRDDSGLTVHASGAGPAGLYSMVLVSGAPSDGTPVGEPFTTGGGSRDVDLVRDIIEVGEFTAVADAEAAPNLVLVVEGTVNVATPEIPEGVVLGAGEARTLDGELTITNAGEASAEIFAAVVGPRVEIAAPVPTTVPATTSTTSSATSSTTSSTTTSTTTTTVAPTDTDNDGLSDADESIIGSDPNNPDTDGDAIDDGAEVNDYGTSPLLEDSDVDGIGDYAELDVYGTDPVAFDSDGDGVGDGAEVNATLTDPLDDDTDDDGLNDGDEGSLGTDPLGPDTDLDGVNDGTEVGAGTNPLDPASF